MPEKDSRGFLKFVEFVDMYGSIVTVKESSAWGMEKCWIFVHNDDPNFKQRGSMHLNKEQARKIRDALNEFLDTRSERSFDHA